jgi:hypothetical protein
MERMDLIAINNRSLCNHSKVQRAGRTTRKLNRAQDLPLSDPTLLRLDYRRRRSLKTDQKRDMMGGREEVETELCEQYIEEYLQQLREERRFDILGDRAKLIEEACKQIISRVEATRKKPPPSILNASNGNNSVSPSGHQYGEAESIEVRELRLPGNPRKARSITEVEYSEELTRVPPSQCR